MPCPRPNLGPRFGLGQGHMLTLKAVRSILRQYNIRPSKRLGQNFLIDKNIQRKIIDAAGVSEEDTVLEIGAGLGALTEELCRRAKKVVAIEKDNRLYNLLLQTKTPNNLELIHGDILKFSAWRQYGATHQIKVIGNLPYYISSPILIHLLHNRDFIDTIFVSVQKEFGERLVARPGTKDYGSISCLVQFYTEPVFLFTIRKTAFYPAPQVDSCFLKISVRGKGLYLTDEEKLFKIIRTCFAKRRKTILNSLDASGIFASRQETLERLKKVGLSPRRRPETISLQEFVGLTNIINERG